MLIHAHRKMIYVDHYLLEYEDKQEKQKGVGVEMDMDINEKIVINQEIIFSLVRNLAKLY